jgi:hypothetical protein
MTLLEKDMKASGPTFLSILFKNKELALKTNLVEAKQNDFVGFLMEKTEHFFHHNLFELVKNKYKKKSLKNRFI